MIELIPEWLEWQEKKAISIYLLEKPASRVRGSGGVNPNVIDCCSFALCQIFNGWNLCQVLQGLKTH